MKEEDHSNSLPQTSVYPICSFTNPSKANNGQLRMFIWRINLQLQKVSCDLQVLSPVDSCVQCFIRTWTVSRIKQQQDHHQTHITNSIIRHNWSKRTHTLTLPFIRALKCVRCSSTAVTLFLLFFLFRWLYLACIGITLLGNIYWMWTKPNGDCVVCLVCVQSWKLDSCPMT